MTRTQPIADHDVPPPERNDRTGAVWVTATGALLLFAAAATFVAVRWEELRDWQKFAALVVVTQLLLIGGWVGRQRVPATAAAMFSLGAVLVPLDAWTVAASGHGNWQRGLFVGGALGTLTLPPARRWFDTVALRWAWILAVPAAVAGAAAMTGFVPTGVVVAAIGLLALGGGMPSEGRWWLTLGAITPLAALAAPLLPVGDGVLADLGLVGAAVPWTTAATAVLLIAAVVLDGRRSGRTDLIVAALSLAAADLVVAMTMANAEAGSWSLAIAAVFLMAEVVATAVDDDPFWGRRARPAAAAIEVASALGWLLLIAARFGVQTPRSATVAPSAAAIAATLLAIGWLASDARRGRSVGRPARDLLRGAPSTAAGWAVACSAALAVASLDVPNLWLRIGFGAIGAAMLLGRRAGGWGIGALLLTVSGLAVTTTTASAVVTLLALAALAIAVRREADRWAMFLGSMLIGGALFVSGSIFAIDSRNVTAVSAAIALAGLALGSLASARRNDALGGLFPWMVSSLAIVSAFTDPPGQPVIPFATAVVCVGWWVAEAVARRAPIPTILAIAASPAVTIAGLLWIDIRSPQSGVGLAIAAVALVGAAIIVPRPIGRPLLLAAVWHLGVGVIAAAGSPADIGVVLTIAGLLMVTVAVLDGRAVLAYNGAGLALLGGWQALAGHHVTVPEAYLAPLALVLLLAGAHARAVRSVSSWVAYVPPIAVLGGGAFWLRALGEPGWHGVVAGTVAIAAIALGGADRLAGPLFTGSFLLAAITVNETLTRTAGVPTWIWLATGGIALLGAGVSMELHGLGPVESGKRIVELVSDRFE